ncbi:triose-phosphate isomerase [Aliamphritea ceti]|uniref:triose-phosphate isomerase n=1 Tax=Aliamphritea ceti TaxID=1524258 RepID=UPI0021C3F315|nr:triose-phosphate isomerase [Aliamphritea ceti]
MRKTIVAGNWKMNGTREANRELLSQLVAGVEIAHGVEVLVCPPAVYLDQATELVKGSAIKVGAQNVSDQPKGAFTGETALSMLQDLGCEYVLLGHSERRTLFAETDMQVAEKFAAALAADIVPVLCVGETLEQREASETLPVVAAQIAAVSDRVGIAAMAQTVIAYEPVWAIGTGLTATPQQAQEVHAAIRAQLKKLDADVADSVSILYGGSMNASNAAELLSEQDIDGGLVGGASLKAEDFLTICGAAAARLK